MLQPCEHVLMHTPALSVFHSMWCQSPLLITPQFSSHNQANADMSWKMTLHVQLNRWTFGHLVDHQSLLVCIKPLSFQPIEMQPSLGDARHSYASITWPGCWPQLALWWSIFDSQLYSHWSCGHPCTSTLTLNRTSHPTTLIYKQLHVSFTSFGSNPMFSCWHWMRSTLCHAELSVAAFVVRTRKYIMMRTSHSGIEVELSPTLMLFLDIPINICYIVLASLLIMIINDYLFGFFH